MRTGVKHVLCAVVVHGSLGNLGVKGHAESLSGKTNCNEECKTNLQRRGATPPPREAQLALRYRLVGS